MPVTIVILAAGASRRLGRPKQLVEIDGAYRVASAVAKTIVMSRGRPGGRMGGVPPP